MNGNASDGKAPVQLTDADLLKDAQGNLVLDKDGNPIAGDPKAYTTTVTASAPSQTSSWTGTFASSFFTGFSVNISPGSCYALAMETAAAPANSVISAIRSVRGQITPLVPLLPVTGISAGNILYRMASTVARMPGSTAADVAVFTTVANVVASAASNVSAAASTLLSRTSLAVAAATDGALAVGVFQEASAALNGTCKP